MSLTREQILAANDRQLVEIPVPEWGGSVHVAPMSGAAREEFEEYLKANKDDLKAVRATLVSMVAVDENGDRLFSKSDVSALTEKNWKALDRIYSEAVTINKLGEKAVEEAEKN